MCGRHRRENKGHGHDYNTNPVFESEADHRREFSFNSREYSISFEHEIHDKEVLVNPSPGANNDAQWKRAKVQLVKLRFSIQVVP